MFTAPTIPLVSALMVFSRPERRKLALLSARSFLFQTWPRKELVVFNSTRRRLFLFPRRNVREIRLRQRSPSQMLEVCFENSNGIWCSIWWDDCVYRSDYLETLVKEAEPGALTYLTNKTVFDKGTNQTYATDDPVVVCPLFARCRSVNFGLELAPQFEAVKPVSNDAGLVVKVVRVLHE